jgi:hypothetical protein
MDPPASFILKGKGPQYSQVTFISPYLTSAHWGHQEQDSSEVQIAPPSSRAFCSAHATFQLLARHGPSSHFPSSTASYTLCCVLDYAYALAHR